MDTVKDTFTFLYESIQKDREKLKQYHQENNKIRTEDILMRLAGSFCYCVVPNLSVARKYLEMAIKKAATLTDVTTEYDTFYTQIDNFLKLYKKMKEEGLL